MASGSVPISELLRIFPGVIYAKKIIDAGFQAFRSQGLSSHFVL
jgi:hypothetical protein